MYTNARTIVHNTNDNDNSIIVLIHKPLETINTISHVCLTFEHPWGSNREGTNFGAHGAITCHIPCRFLGVARALFQGEPRGGILTPRHLARFLARVDVSTFLWTMASSTPSFLEQFARPVAEAIFDRQDGSSRASEVSSAISCTSLAFGPFSRIEFQLVGANKFGWTS